MKKQKQMHYWNSETLDKQNERIRIKRQLREDRKAARAAAERPPDTRDITPSMAAQPGFYDLTGSEFGLGAKVIGLSIHNRKWLCRCSCGGSFLRATNTVVNLSINGSAADGADFCDECRLKAEKKIKETRIAIGKFLSIEEKVAIFSELV